MLKKLMDFLPHMGEEVEESVDNLDEQCYARNNYDDDYEELEDVSDDTIEAEIRALRRDCIEFVAYFALVCGLVAGTLFFIFFARKIANSEQ